jgi:hypothetical protein
MARGSLAPGIITPFRLPIADCLKNVDRKNTSGRHGPRVGSPGQCAREEVLTAGAGLV